MMLPRAHVLPCSGLTPVTTYTTLIQALFYIGEGLSGHLRKPKQLSTAMSALLASVNVYKTRQNEAG